MWRTRHAFCVVVMMLQLTGGIACSRRPVDAAAVVGPAFEGFVYVGSFPADQYSPPSHGYDPVRLPQTFAAGRLYVFHYAGPLDDAEFAVRELPKRLRAAGATIIESPSSKAELPSVDPGDRAWRVVFKYDSLRGTSYNALDRDLFQRGGMKPGGNVNSFVLKFDPV